MLVSRLLALRTSLAALLARAADKRRPTSHSTLPAQGIYRAPPELPSPPPEPPPPAAPEPKPSRPRRAPLIRALGSSVLEPGARKRTSVVAALGGLGAITVAVHFESVAPVYRLLALALGLLLLLPGLVALWGAYRAQSAPRAERAAPRRRVVEERRPAALGAPRTLAARPPPTPDLRVQRRRWRRRG